jgi:hypothetical protein
MRIPIKALKEFAQRYGLVKIIVFAHDQDNKTDHIATYGKTIEDSSQAADFGNLLKDFLDWPESLHAQPSRVRRLQARIKELEDKEAWYQQVEARIKETEDRLAAYVQKSGDPKP